MIMLNGSFNFTRSYLPLYLCYPLECHHVCCDQVLIIRLHWCVVSDKYILCGLSCLFFCATL
jgi:hypothetical protein